MRRSTSSIVMTLILLLAMTPAQAEDTTTPITAWLQDGPVSLQLPAFNDEDKGAFAAADLLKFPARDISGLSLDNSRRWKDVAAQDGTISLDADGLATTWLAAYLHPQQWSTPTLELTSAHPLRAFLDGKEISLSQEETVSSATLKLQTGAHLLIVQCLRDPEVEEAWTLQAALKSEAVVAVNTNPKRGVQIRDVLDAPRIGSVNISPDGKKVVLTMSAYSDAGVRQSWIEIRDTDKGDLILSWRGAVEASQLQWLPDSRRFSYVSRQDAKATIWIHDLVDQTVTVAARDIEDFENYAWNPDGKTLIYAFGVEPEKSDSPAKRLTDIEDRWPWWRSRSYLVEVSLEDGLMRRLTAGDQSVSGWTFSPKGTHLLFTRSYPDPLNRPYYTQELWEMDLADLGTEMVLDEKWLDSAVYSKDRNSLILVASPSAFDGLGRDLPDGVMPNDYGGQVYLYDRSDKQPKAISVDYDPTIRGLAWHRSGKIVTEVLDTQYVYLATADLDGNWKAVDSGVETMSDWSLARNADRAVVVGTGATVPQKLYVVDLKKNKASLLLDPGAERYNDVAFGQVENFACTLDDGMVLDGRVHFPLNYDPDKSYPVIVYYYGGTSPITRDFGGRYPKNVWTSRDYFVYVPNPSGALGYGQAFSAKHVNDWGILTAGEVIQGTEKFLAAHPAADRENMACIGASYGGFLTMYLITQTDMFKTAVSHAGISSISSYWAEGYWGYLYGGRALAESFPWNNRELYVEQSPLFLADRINTPLLLLHGFDDTNVPKGESDGLYTALKMLGREVEYIQIEGQDHHILDHEKRIVWNDTILAWFAKELKGDSGLWNEMYGD
jgi:dipeptidyl aminopeptidase/acylaminoacyl peptidase